jgi:hypothetical protein
MGSAGSAGSTGSTGSSTNIGNTNTTTGTSGSGNTGLNGDPGGNSSITSNHGDETTRISTIISAIVGNESEQIKKRLQDKKINDGFLFSVKNGGLRLPSEIF